MSVDKISRNRNENRAHYPNRNSGNRNSRNKYLTGGHDNMGHRREGTAVQSTTMTITPVDASPGLHFDLNHPSSEFLVNSAFNDPALINVAKMSSSLREMGSRDSVASHATSVEMAPAVVNAVNYDARADETAF